MPDKKILYVTTEMFPYQEDSSMATMVNKMALKMYGDGNDVRVFMPKFGLISERRFQLHEVIRLSGMNIIINDLDQPLIIKVASLPGERLQVYFIDNEDYFKRKFFYFDEEGKPFDDNDERAVFFARGVIETIKKLNWVPDIIHLNGWMSAMVAVYLKNYYKNDYYFKNTKLVMSVFNEEEVPMGPKIKEVLAFDNIKGLASLKKPGMQTLMVDAMNMVDTLVMGDEFLEGDLGDAFSKAKSDKKDYVPAESIGDIY